MIKGTKHSEKTLEKIRIGVKKWLTPEVRKRMSLSHTGKPSSAKGKRWSEESREKLRRSRIGKKHSKETCRKIGVANAKRKGLFSGKKNPNWKGGHSPERQTLYARVMWKEIAKSVLKRDNYVCQKCGTKYDKNNRLVVHHKKQWSCYPELRFDLNNLITLCEKCHKQIHFPKKIYKNMKRLYIPLDKIKIYDEMHKLQSDGSFIVDESKDGKSTEEHLRSIEYIKVVLTKGKKIMPILVLDNGEGRYIRLDGFKRCIAQKELGYKNIEAFVCDIGEYEYQKKIPFLDGEMLCWKGGQPKEVFPLFEGTQTGEEFDYDKVRFLYKSEKPDGLRIEIDENVHVHFGAYGKNRLTLGKEDFINLAEAISKI